MSDSEITDEDINRWKAIAQSRLDDGHPADEAALATIIKLCDLVIKERHPKSLFENLWYQGVEENERGIR